MPYYVYMLASRPRGTLDIGVTRGLMWRAFKHRHGAVPGFASRYGVSRPVWFEVFDDVTAAIQREKTMKHWLRAWRSPSRSAPTRPGATCTTRSRRKYRMGPRVKPEDDRKWRQTHVTRPVPLQVPV
jgi:putative endonuclease